MGSARRIGSTQNDVASGEERGHMDDAVASAEKENIW